MQYEVGLVDLLVSELGELTEKTENPDRRQTPAQVILIREKKTETEGSDQL